MSPNNGTITDPILSSPLSAYIALGKTGHPSMTDGLSELPMLTSSGLRQYVLMRPSSDRHANACAVRTTVYPRPIALADGRLAGNFPPGYLLNSTCPSMYSTLDPPGMWLNEAAPIWFSCPSVRMLADV